MKLLSSFELNREHFALHLVSSPHVKPFIYHIQYPNVRSQKSAYHVAPLPIEAIIYDDRIELDNVPAKYKDSDYVKALKASIRLSLIGA